ncbi:MAG: type I addiction module toxin, SymE family [Methanothrix sp.]|nr:MAG: type I addiction module toxin, SymE family [Methanothrix sp.]
MIDTNYVNIREKGMMPYPISTDQRTLKIEPTGDLHRGPFVSLIRLRGNWLRKAGFIPGERVAVKVEQGKIVLTPIIKMHQ